MTEAEVTLPAAVSSVPTARRFVESILSGWGMPSLGWTATLIVSELAANAALHARGEEFSIRVSVENDGIRVEVQDASLRQPQQRAYSHDATTTPTTGGKTVWALVRAEVAADDDAEVDVDALLLAFSDDGDGDGDGGADADVIPLADRRNRPEARGPERLAATA
jgi:anti-sigma regulatory factor (Ser/Thr protein kinase)